MSSACWVRLAERALPAVWQGMAKAGVLWEPRPLPWMEQLAHGGTTVGKGHQITIGGH